MQGNTVAEGTPELAPWLRALARLATAPSTAALSLLFATPNATEQTFDLGEGMRVTTRPGELYGVLQRQQPNGEWTTDGTLIRPDQISSTSMLTPEERARLLAPLVTPRPPPAGPTVLITLPIPDAEQRAINLPGPGPEIVPALPTIEIFPALPQSWEDLIIESRDSRILGDSLTAAGDAKPGDGYQAHHIVPTNDPRGADLLRLLQNAGIDPNLAENGVWLPANSDVPGNGETPHNETMRNSYFDYVRDVLAGVNDRADIESRLTQIRDYLRNGQGDFPLKGP